MILKKRKKTKGMVFVVSGPSGSGKTTLIGRLLTKKKFKKSLVKIISCTTRLPRGREKKDKEYIFITRQEFKKRTRNKEFLEQQNVFGEYYGTPKQAVVDALNSAKDALLCIDVKGAKALKKFRSFHTVYIFILPSDGDWQKALKARLRRRRSDSQKQMRKRLLLAGKEIASAKDYDYLIFNKNINQASTELAKIVDRERRGK